MDSVLNVLSNKVKILEKYIKRLKRECGVSPHMLNEKVLLYVDKVEDDMDNAIKSSDELQGIVSECKLDNTSYKLTNNEKKKLEKCVDKHRRQRWIDETVMPIVLALVASND
uniref:Uncharacterized protein n=1 Tax=Megaviridae environmental sample TaxID=1737588 RepID=A0A5J6VIH3_9VIRU|nr:MAG: hypothetical protein [Megaviridae environmental sample]